LAGEKSLAFYNVKGECNMVKEYMTLTSDQCKELVDKGFIHMHKGEFSWRVTMDDLVISKPELEKLISMKEKGK
jgi:hypothetical protein